MRVYLLVDQSGSMAGQWSDTIGAVNAYVAELGGDTNVYLATFDSGYNGDMSYTVHRNTTARGFKPLIESEARPRGGTPLLDAMAKTLDHAFNEAPEKAYFVVMTDGYENTSKTATKQLIREKLARAEDRKWEVVFLGANFDNVTEQATSIGLNLNKSYNISTKNLGDEMRFMASATTAYAMCGARTEFTAMDRMRGVK